MASAEGDDGDNGLPAEKVLHQRQDGLGVGRSDGGLAFGGDIAGQPHHFPFQLAAAIQGPLIAVGVDQVGKILKALPLLLVIAL